MGITKRDYQEIEELKQYAKSIVEEMLINYPLNLVIEKLEELQEKLLNE